MIVAAADELGYKTLKRQQQDLIIVSSFVSGGKSFCSFSGP